MTPFISIRLSVFALMMILLATSCNFYVSGIKKDNEISSKEHRAVEAIVKDVHNGFISRNSTLITPYLSPRIEKESEVLNSIIEVGLVNANSEATILREYMITNVPQLSINSISSETRGEEFTFFFQPQSMETYIVLYSSKGVDTADDLMTVVVFNKENDNWEIEQLNISMLSHKGQLAPYYFNEAEVKYTTNELVQAYFLNEYASILGQPGGAGFHFKKEEELKKKHADIRSSFFAKYPFPLIINKLRENVVISGLQPHIEAGYAYFRPQVNYTTTQSSLEAVKMENQNLHSMINTILPGINSIADTIVYKVSYGANEVYIRQASGSS